MTRANKGGGSHFIPQLKFPTPSQKCSPQLFGDGAQIEELALLYRFMPSIPRETLKTYKSRSNDLSFPQLYKLELASLTRLSPDDGCNRHVGNSLKK